MKSLASKAGFSLVEIMIVVSIIGILMVVAFPAFQKARLTSQITRIASDLSTFSDAFQLYALQRGNYPVDTHDALPPGMTEYIKQNHWDADVFGGRYNWEGPSWGEGGSYAYAGISLFGTTADTSTLEALDSEIDNGNLSSGWFRQTPNGRYTLIIEE